MKRALPWLVVLLAMSPSHAGDNHAEFKAHTFNGHGGVKLPYRMLKPEHIGPGKTYPVVLILHGWGERGTDNNKQLKDFGPVFLNPAVDVCSAERQARGAV